MKPVVFLGLIYLWREVLGDINSDIVDNKVHCNRDENHLAFVLRDKEPHTPVTLGGIPPNVKR